MPKVTSSKQLVELVQRSELVEEDKLRACLAQLARDRGRASSDDPEALAEQLVRSELLTRWQVNQLLKGKYRGFKLGKYTLKGHLGTGGMSSVYLSEHPIMRRPVAIKVLPKSRVAKSSYLERFELEARAVAALDHPNIVRAYDIDNDEDTHYIVMEYVEGRDLQRIVDQEGPLPFDRAADYIAQAAAGLQHAHEAGVIHRDIKPANCLVDSHGVLKVLDMGLAKFTQDKLSLSAVYKDNVVGTADYLAPEQAINSSRVDSRADIYALGGTLYFLLTGSPPFPDGTLAERLLKHQKEEPRSIYRFRPDAPAKLVDLCRRMMMKNADHRVQTAGAVYEELRSWLEGRGITLSAGLASIGRLSSLATPTVSAGTDSRWDRLARIATGAPAEKKSTAGDTAPSAHGDTHRIDDQPDELSLAPIEDDRAAAGGTSASGQTGRSDVSPEDGDVDPEVLSLIEEQIGDASSTSGSLVDLLELQQPATVPPSSIRLGRRRHTGAPQWLWWVIGLCVSAVLIVLLLLFSL